MAGKCPHSLGHPPPLRPKSAAQTAAQGFAPADSPTTTANQKKGDTSNEVRKGTFLKRLDTCMNIGVDMEWTTLYLVARLLVTFLQGASKGNPVRIRNCPAAVSRIEHPHVTGSLQNREDGSVETPVNV